MQITKNRRKIKTEGLQNEHNFAIDITSKTFDILFSQLYSEPIRAIVRELSTNAADAHIENGNPNDKFKVNLPNTLNPMFWIRDYGTGLTPEEVHQIYTTVFRSTKTDTNTQTGCLGLGSKSPFSYSDSFIVESFKDGKHYIYNLFMNDEGIPAIGEAGVQPTDEPNGLKISIAIEPKDFEAFRDAAEKTYEYFDVIPEITGQDIVVQQPNYVYKGTFWQLRKHGGSWNSDNNARAIMGNVCYKLDPYNTAFSNDDRDILQSPFDITFDIGKLDIEPSRENLRFDKQGRTAANIKNAIEKIKEELVKLIEQELASAKNKWEAFIAYDKARTTLPGGSIIDASKLEFNGEPLFEPSRINSYNKRAGTNLNLSQDVRHVTYSSYNGKTSATFLRNISPKEEIKIVINDLKTGYLARAKHYVQQNPEEEILLVAPKDDSDIDGLVEELLVDKSYCTLASDLPEYKMVTTSTNATTTNSNKPRAKPKRVLLFKPNQNTKTSSWEKAGVSLDDSGFYVKMDNYDCIIGSKMRDPQYLNKVLKAMKAFNYPVDKIIGVRKSMYKKFDESPNWRNYDSYAQRILSNIACQFNYKEYIRHADVNSLYFSKRFEDEVFPLLNKDTLYYKHLSKIKRRKILKLYEKKSILLKALEGEMFNAKHTIGDELISVSEMKSELKEEYPIFGLINDYKLKYTDELKTNAKHIANYVNNL